MAPEGVDFDAGAGRSRSSRGQHVSNAAGGAEQDERDDEAPYLEGAASARWPSGPWCSRGSNGVIDRIGQIQAARHRSASVLVIQNPCLADLTYFRAMPEPMSGLFWWSPIATSTGTPADLA
jgi:hypothetical protein